MSLLFSCNFLCLVSMYGACMCFKFDLNFCLFKRFTAPSYNISMYPAKWLILNMVCLLSKKNPCSLSSLLSPVWQSIALHRGEKVYILETSTWAVWRLIRWFFSVTVKYRCKLFFWGLLLAHVRGTLILFIHDIWKLIFYSMFNSDLIIFCIN